MEKMELKKMLLRECISVQKKAADLALAEMNEANQSANEYGNPEDWFDTFKTDMLNKRDMFSVQLMKILDDIKRLEKIDAEKILDKVEFGSVVILSGQKLFVSVGIGKIQAGGETYFAISPSVPVFQALRYKKKGDTYEFRGQKGEIKDVF
jgi:transcription elongation GreA/GreB family factor